MQEASLTKLKLFRILFKYNLKPMALTCAAAVMKNFITLFFVL